MDETKSITPGAKTKSLEATDNGVREAGSTIDLLFRNKPRWRPYMLAIAVLALVLGLMLMGVVWLYAIPPIWNSWVVAPVSNEALTWAQRLLIIPGILIVFFIFSLSIWLPGAPVVFLSQIARLYAESANEHVAGQIRELSRDQEEAEKQLEHSDRAGLVPLVRYSRMQLEKYYTIGFNQTRRSFRYSVAAMWLGFAVILSGLIFQVLPLEQIFPESGLMKEPDFNVVALAGGTVVEIIAALFLWVYRSSMQQLTYYYDRQMHIHDVILCFRMASSTKEPDAIVGSIIDEVLKHTWKLEREAAPSGKVIGELFSKAEGKRAA